MKGGIQILFILAQNFTSFMVKAMANKKHLVASFHNLSPELQEEIKQKYPLGLTEAKILVSGGRGVGNTEGFEMLGKLAETLNAEVSSSRAMVDAGVMPHDRQVGQTGKTVRTDQYFAMGISGAIQLLA